MAGLFRTILAFFGMTAGSAAAEPVTVESFHDAVHRGDIAGVRSMLSSDPSLATSRDKWAFQPIHLMDMYFEREILDLLIANGADINAANDEGVTILHIVTEPEAVAVLVQKGADLEARDANGWTPLIMQANNQQNGPDVLQALIDAGADVNAKGSEGETALGFARETGETDFEQALLAAGARE